MIFEVEKVTFFEDRASVCRVMNTVLKPGIHSFTLKGLSPYLVDKSMVFESDNESAVCVEMHAKRTFKSEEGNLTELKEKREKLDILESELNFASNSLSAKSYQRQQLMAKISKDCAKGKGKAEEWGAAFSLIRNLENELMKTVQELKDKKEKLAETINELQVQHLQIKKEYHSEITLSVDVKEEAKYNLKVHYVTAAACWRPVYKAFVETDKVRFKKGASIWQHCGEKWIDILVELSTERQQKAQLPVLEADILKTKRKVSEELVMREELIEETELVEKSTYQVPGIDDDGAVFKSTVEKRVTLPSQEQAVTVDFDEFISNTSRELVSFPMLSTYVNEIVHFENTTSSPLLPAPVSVYRKGVLCGLSEIKYSAPGQKIKLDCGNLENIVIKRQEKSDTESKMLSSWTTESHKVELNISNLGSEETVFVIKERIPVSETDKAKIQVDEKKSSPVKFPNDKGIIEWKVTLPAFGRDSIELCYDVKMQV